MQEIPWSEVIFLVDDLKRDPAILEITKYFFKRIGAAIPDGDTDMLQKLTEGLLIKVWLIHGGKIE
ncbi:MAG: hypothetical protein A2542_00160 [Parcubacteria group bacterium RIFOXYD2_FULL_52_8]|nr:MAG: hypothetical protein A2542_00160 [Parcubacteria group bacterium RIFOXYD2_FULL_52_8]